MSDPVQSDQATQFQPQPTSGSPTQSKETEGGIALGEPFPLKDIGTHEAELPKEVVAVGVSARPTNVTIPPRVGQMGVQAVGLARPISQSPKASLPLTDDQIALGLKQNITSSWRWLAEWCMRKIKQLQRTVINT